MSPLVETLTLLSPAFQHQGNIPIQYTCDGHNISPPLNLYGIPEGTCSLSLIVEDPDAPNGTWDHWLLWNIAPNHKHIAENEPPPEATTGTNDFGRQEYGGPCPPSGMHHYHFKLFALDTDLNLPVGARKKELERAMQGHILGKTELIGTYTRF